MSKIIKRITNIRDRIDHYKECQNSMNLLYNPFLEYTGNYLFSFYLRNIISIFEKEENKDDYFTNDVINENESNSDQFSIDLKEYKEKTFFFIFNLLFSLKFGKNKAINLINNQKIMDDILLFDLKERIISFLKTRKCSDIEFINLCISMNNHTPEDLPGIEDIYINIKKKINNNSNIREIMFAFQNDDKKLILELQKYDKINNIEINVKKSRNKKFNFKKKDIIKN